MRLALAEQTIDATTVVGVPELINAKDRHVVAAAMAAEATCVVTNDEALRGEITESAIGLEPLDGNAFAESTDGVVGVVVEMAADRRNPPMTTGDVLDALERAGVGRFATVARAHLRDR